jgi:hypothetical protein
MREDEKRRVALINAARKAVKDLRADDAVAHRWMIEDLDAFIARQTDVDPPGPSGSEPR